MARAATLASNLVFQTSFKGPPCLVLAIDPPTRPPTGSPVLGIAKQGQSRQQRKQGGRPGGGVDWDDSRPSQRSADFIEKEEGKTKGHPGAGESRQPAQ